jgi:hypothetical protein
MAFLESALRREIVSREPEAFRRTYVPIQCGLRYGRTRTRLIVMGAR